MLAAIVCGGLRWPWWTLIPVLAVGGIWTWHVELVQIHGLRTQFGEPPPSITDEVVLISAGAVIFAAVVAYVIARAIRTMNDRQA